jgi:hypothetical protein
MAQAKWWLLGYYYADRLEPDEDWQNCVVRAREAKDPSIARRVFFGRDLNWLCGNCPYALKCAEIRDKEDKMENFAG